jgi:hypothetical protein
MRRTFTSVDPEDILAKARRIETSRATIAPNPQPSSTARANGSVNPNG